MADRLLTTTLVAAVDSHLATCSDLRQRAFSQYHCPAPLTWDEQLTLFKRRFVLTQPLWDYVWAIPHT